MESPGTSSSTEDASTWCIKLTRKTFSIARGIKVARNIIKNSKIKTLIVLMENNGLRRSRICRSDGVRRRLLGRFYLMHRGNQMKHKYLCLLAAFSVSMTLGTVASAEDAQIQVQATEAMELLIKKLKETASNAEFLLSLKM